MNNPQSVSHTFSGTDKTVSFETGRLAGLAGGAVLAQLGDTTVLVTATGAKSPRPGADFFPLTVDIEERMYAAGKIPGSFFRREGRAPESAILTCRLLDRPLRPMFPDGYRNEVHIVGTIMGAALTGRKSPYPSLRATPVGRSSCPSMSTRRDATSNQLRSIKDVEARENTI